MSLEDTNRLVKTENKDFVTDSIDVRSNKLRRSISEEIERFNFSNAVNLIEQAILSGILPSCLNEYKELLFREDKEGEKLNGNGRNKLMDDYLLVDYQRVFVGNSFSYKLGKNELYYSESNNKLGKRTEEKENEYTLPDIRYIAWISMKAYCYLQLSQYGNAVNDIRNVLEYCEAGTDGGLMKSGDASSKYDDGLCVVSEVATFSILNPCYRVNEMYYPLVGSNKIADERRRIFFYFRLICSMTAIHVINKNTYYENCLDSLFLLLNEIEIILDDIRERSKREDEVKNVESRESVSVVGFASGEHEKEWFYYMQVVCYLISHVLTLRDHWIESISLYKRVILTRYPHHLSTLSILGRFCLHIGCVEAAEEYFGLVECLCEDDIPLIRYNSALLNLSQNDPLSTIMEFDAAISLNNQNGRNSPTKDFIRDSAPSEIAVAMNNSAVAALYCARLSTAIQQAEAVVFCNVNDPSFKDNSSRYIFPINIKNLQTFYEFHPTRRVKLEGLQNYILQNNSDQGRFSQLFE